MTIVREGEERVALHFRVGGIQIRGVDAAAHERAISEIVIHALHVRLRQRVDFLELTKAVVAAQKFVAEAEMQLRVLWEEILKRGRIIDVMGEPERVMSNFVRGYASLPVRIRSA